VEEGTDVRAFIVLSLLVMAACPARAMAMSPASGSDAAMFASAAAVGDDELSEQRGGFVVDGLDIKLGAQIQTLIDGQLSLTTTINWTGDSATTTQTVSGLTPATAAQLQAGVLNTGKITMNVGNASVFLGNSGQTAILQGIDGGIQSILVNTANNTNIQTQVNATLDLSGYQAFQNNLQSGTMANSLGQAIGAATAGVLMH
jgi:tetrahydromethanopterin S-methyltransferase subunit F